MVLVMGNIVAFPGFAASGLKLYQLNEHNAYNGIIF